MASPKIIFAGTPDFAAASLAALIQSGHTPCAVLTQPDRPAGRGKKLTASPVKQVATDHGIAVLQPATLKDADSVAAIEALQPDLMVVAAYGLILPQTVLDIPRAGCVNVHASLLPRWRGAAPVQAAILAGDPKTGVCLMGMEAGLDTGPVFARTELEIGSDETAGELHDRLAAAGAELLKTHVDDLISGELQPVPQDDALATYAHKFRTADAEIDWHESAAVLDAVPRLPHRSARRAVHRTDRSERLQPLPPAERGRLLDPPLRPLRSHRFRAARRPQPGLVHRLSPQGADRVRGSTLITQKFSDTPKECASCHTDVHRGQFEDYAGCDVCHTSHDRFGDITFDHDTQSDWPLDGAHEKVPCAQCHVPEPHLDGGEVVRFKPIPHECGDCHDIRPEQGR